METLILYGQLFWQFFKTGLFAVGGGLATLPFLQEMSRLTHWFTTTDIADMVAVSESTPGPLGVNMATYVGFKTAGFAGGAIATLGLIAPSIIIILIIARMLRRFQSSAIVSQIFFRPPPCVSGPHHGCRPECRTDCPLPGKYLESYGKPGRPL